MTDLSAETGLVLVPAYNEEAAVAEVVRRAARHLPVLVVDDGSRDATAARAEDAGAEVLRQTPNQGKGAALRAGFRSALARSNGFVVTLDADGQHDPEEIPSFLRRRRERAADLIIGARRFEQMPFVRRMSNRFARRALSWAVGRPILDNQSGYRLIGRRLLELLLESDESGFEFEVEMIATCIREALGLDWVPIRTIYAGEASHIDPWAHTVNFLRIVRKARTMVRGPARGR